MKIFFLLLCVLCAGQGAAAQQLLENYSMEQLQQLANHMHQMRLCVIKATSDTVDDGERDMLQREFMAVKETLGGPLSSSLGLSKCSLLSYLDAVIADVLLGSISKRIFQVFIKKTTDHFVQKTLSDAYLDPAVKKENFLHEIGRLSNQSQDQMLADDDRSIVNIALQNTIQALIANFQDTFTPEQIHFISAANICTVESAKSLYDYLKAWKYTQEDDSVDNVPFDGDTNYQESDREMTIKNFEKELIDNIELAPHDTISSLSFEGLQVPQPSALPLTVVQCLDVMPLRCRL